MAGIVFSGLKTSIPRIIWKVESMKKLLLYSALVVSAIAPFLAAPANAGPTEGYVFRQDTIKAGETKTYTIQFNEDEDAVVDMDTKGDGHLSMCVSDVKNKIVAQSKAMVNPRCDWTPKKTDAFKIVVANTGDHDINYTLDAW